MLDAGLLDQPLRKADPKLGIMLERMAQEVLSRLPAAESLIDQVRRIVVEEMRRGEPGLETVADRLSVAARTLQRRLKDEGTTLQDIVEMVRKDFALHYLRMPQMAIGEAAFLLGFSESSAFHRAFKRWTGMTPGEYRRLQAGPASAI